MVCNWNVERNNNVQNIQICKIYTFGNFLITDLINTINVSFFIVKYPSKFNNIVKTGSLSLIVMKMCFCSR